MDNQNNYYAGQAVNLHQNQQQNLPPIGSEFLTPKATQISGQLNVIGSPHTVVRNQNSLLNGNMNNQVLHPQGIHPNPNVNN